MVVAAERERLAAEMLPLVRSLCIRLGDPREYAWGDTFGDGCVGLVRALNTYRDGMGTSFATYATLKISGEIIDRRREHDVVPRNVRKLARLGDARRWKLCVERGTMPPAAEIETDFPGYQKASERVLLGDAPSLQIVEHVNENQRGSVGIGFGEAVVADSSQDPAAILERGCPEVHEAIARLAPQYRKAIEWHYFEGATLYEVAQRLGVVPSRASQVHRQALAHLRSAILNPFNYGG